MNVSWEPAATFFRVDEDRCYSLLRNGVNHLQHCCMSKSRRWETVFIPCDLNAKCCKVEMLTDCFQYCAGNSISYTSVRRVPCRNYSCGIELRRRKYLQRIQRIQSNLLTQKLWFNSLHFISFVFNSFRISVENKTRVTLKYFLFSDMTPSHWIVSRRHSVFFFKAWFGREGEWFTSDGMLYARRKERATTSTPLRKMKNLHVWNNFSILLIWRGLDLWEQLSSVMFV